MPFTALELEYLRGQRLGRLATVGPDGAPQTRPVAFHVNEELETIDIGGFVMGKTQKYRNVQADGRVSFVVDDLASVDPWRVRGVEIRGVAEAVTGDRAPSPEFSHEVIRVHPRRILVWGLDEDHPRVSARNV